jgi:hypothetical protein
MRITTVPLRTFVGFCFFAAGAANAGLTYHVTTNPDVCQEVHLGWMSPPRGVVANNVDSGHCRYEIRAAGEMLLYVSATCDDMRAWVTVRQKYAVDLSHRGGVHRISDTAWESASPLRRGDGGITPPESERGVRFKGGPLLERSGPKWAGEGHTPIDATIDLGGRWVAVYSWDGFNILYTFMDPAAWGRRSNVEGRYWIDIYDAVSGERLIKMEGAFKGISPNHIFGYASAWYGGYFVVPLGRILDPDAMMLQKLLICDADAASRKSNAGLKERK